MKRLITASQTTESNYKLAADMFNNCGAECQALSEYVSTLSTDENNLPSTVVDGITERSGDELNHLLGDMLDAIELLGLKIAPDGKDEIMKRIEACFDVENS